MSNFPTSTEIIHFISKHDQDQIIIFYSPEQDISQGVAIRDGRNIPISISKEKIEALKTNSFWEQV